jgi:hypothetical protein
VPLSCFGATVALRTEFDHRDGSSFGRLDDVALHRDEAGNLFVVSARDTLGRARAANALLRGPRDSWVRPQNQVNYVD